MCPCRQADQSCLGLQVLLNLGDVWLFHGIFRWFSWGVLCFLGDFGFWPYYLGPFTFLGEGGFSSKS